MRSIPFPILAFAEGPTWGTDAVSLFNGKNEHTRTILCGGDNPKDESHINRSLRFSNMAFYGILNFYYCVYGLMSCVCVCFISNKDTLFL